MPRKLKELIRFDWAMKKSLRNKANFDILEGFLSELLRESIKIKQILESESNKESEAVIGLQENGVPILIIAKSLNLTEDKVRQIIAISQQK